jgi:hypothetical protein
MSNSTIGMCSISTGIDKFDKNCNRRPKEKKPLGIFRCKLKGNFETPSRGTV